MECFNCGAYGNIMVISEFNMLMKESIVAGAWDPQTVSDATFKDFSTGFYFS